MSAALSLDADFTDRFWYWRGASGRRYIHSIYAAADCPPFPGAIHVSVAREATGQRVALDLGCFGDNWDVAEMQALEAARGADEVHVHLLAGGAAEADAVLADLRAGLGIARPRHDASRRGPDAATRAGFADNGLPLFDFRPAAAGLMPA